MMCMLVGNQTQIANRDQEWEIHDPRRIATRGVCLDFPHFDGENTMGWIFKVNQYFEYHQTSPRCLFMVSYHMDGEALVWYQDAVESRLFNNWDAFIRALQVRFGPTAYKDPMEALTRLKSTSTLVIYKAHFKSLNRLRGLSEHHKLSCFLSRLNDEIHLAIHMLNPVSLNEAFSLAKIQEEYLLNTRRTFKLTKDRGMSTVSRQQPSLVNQGEGSTRGQKTFVPPRKVTSPQMMKKGIKRAVLPL